MMIWEEDTFDDVLKAPTGGPVEQPDEEDDLPLDGGIGDERGLVRIWADEQGHLERVRISKNWARKLNGTPLEVSFLEVFVALNNQHAPNGVQMPPPPELPPSTKKWRFDWDTLAGWQTEGDEIARRAEQISDIRPSQWVGEEVTGDAYNNRIVVTLDVHGRPARVDFDPGWMATLPTAKDLQYGVLRAYGAACEKHRPPVVDLGDLELLEQQGMQLVQQILSPDTEETN